MFVPFFSFPFPSLLYRINRSEQKRGDSSRGEPSPISCVRVPRSWISLTRHANTKLRLWVD